MKTFQKTICQCEISPHKSLCNAVYGISNRTEFFIDFIDGPLQGVRLFSDIDDDGVKQPTLKESLEELKRATRYADFVSYVMEKMASFLTALTNSLNKLKGEFK